jgi:cytochrome c-type biogenesis protein CcmH
VKKLVLVLFTAGLWLATSAGAAINPLQFADAAEEARYKALIAELRCLVCQNQSLADSNADLADDLRREVYGKMREGKSDKEIVDFLVARYSDFVLYRPPVKATTYMLWFGPFLLFATALAILVVIVRRRRSLPETELSAADQARMRQLLEPTDNPDKQNP